MVGRRPFYRRKSPGRDRASKDFWDKADVVVRGLAGILIPAVVALSVYLWNAERTRLETASNMLQIAVGILQQPSESTEPSAALRNWAISVMKSPDNPPKISDEVAAALATGQLPTIALAPAGSFTFSYLGEQELSEEVQEMLKRYDPKPWGSLFDCTAEGCKLKTGPIPPEALGLDVPAPLPPDPSLVTP